VKAEKEFSLIALGSRTPVYQESSTMSDPFERSPIAQAAISVVLTQQQAEVPLEKVVNLWAAYLDTLGRDHEILVVKDAPSNDDPQLGEGLKAQYPRLRVLDSPGRGSVGAALRIGLEAAQFPLFCYSNCDTCYQPADLGRLLEVIDKVDLVSGYRVWQSPRGRHFWRQHAYRGLLRLLFGLRLMDVNCSLKLFRRSIFARLPIQSEGPFVHAEILAKANFLGCMMTEVPVRYEPNPVHPGTTSLPGTWRADLSRVFFHPDFGPAIST
jgi:hypothetical protein